jgi:hypothetical protein
MRAAQTLVAQRDQGVSASDLRSPAINAAKTIPYLSSLQLEDRCCAAIVSAQIALLSRELNRSISSELSPGASRLLLAAGLSVSTGNFAL